jgi:predicted nucleic acid-binding protein
MTAKIFIDTNVMRYAKFDDSSHKYKIANKLLSQNIKSTEINISTQVVNEFFINALRKGKNVSEVKSIAKLFPEKFNILPVSMQTVCEAWRIFDKYRLSYWDSLIVSAALESQCSALYTEDLANGQIIDNSLRIINPFAGTENG